MILRILAVMVMAICGVGHLARCDDPKPATKPESEADLPLAQLKYELPSVQLEHWSYNALTILSEQTGAEKNSRPFGAGAMTRFEFASVIARMLPLVSKPTNPDGTPRNVLMEIPEFTFGAFQISQMPSRNPDLPYIAAASLVNEYHTELFAIGVPLKVFLDFLPVDKGEYHLSSTNDLEIKADIQKLTSSLQQATAEYENVKIEVGPGGMELVFRAQTYLIHERSRTGSISPQPHIEVGPSNDGLILRIRFSNWLGLQRTYMRDWVMPRAYWSDEDGVMRIRIDETYVAQRDRPVKKGEFLFWTLSYGGRTDAKLKKKIKTVLDEFALTEHIRLQK